MEWFRTPAWDREAQRSFEERLGRSHGKAQHLRLKALALAGTGERAKIAAARELLIRIVEDYPADRYEVPHAHHELGRLAREEGSPLEAIDHFRKAVDAPVRTESKQPLVDLILDEGLEEFYEEADELLAFRLGEGLLFGSQKFRYCLARARLARARAEADEAATFAAAALHLHSTDEPAAPRHPTVGLIAADEETLAQLKELEQSGDPSAFDARVAEHLAAGRGPIDWVLVSQLKDVKGDGGRRDRYDRASQTEKPILEALGSFGVEVRELSKLRLSGFRHKADAVEVAEILMPWYHEVEDLVVKGRLAAAFDDRRAADICKEPLLEDFLSMRGERFAAEGAPDSEEIAELRRFKDDLGRSLSRLLGPDDFDEVAEHITDPLQGHAMAYLYWALPRMREPRVVDAMIGSLDHPMFGASALRVLADLRSERAQSILQAISGEEYPKGKQGDDAFDQRTRVEVARSGLKKLKRAREQGRAIE